MLLRNTMLLLYSPECVKGKFSEVWPGGALL
jgi:hypothetical protein